MSERQKSDFIKWHSKGAFETKAIHTRITQGPLREKSTPIYASSGHTFDSIQQAAVLFSGNEQGFVYARWDNPNSFEFIQKLCLLEGCEDGIATSSGMSAIFLVLAGLLAPGDHFIHCKPIFGTTQQLISSFLTRYGLQTTTVDASAPAGLWEAACQDNTKAILIESPTNPCIDLIDLQMISKLAQAKKLLFFVDNCFATPYLQNPVKWGADIVIHSATKFIDGQGRVLGGAVLGSEELISRIRPLARSIGCALSPFNAWVLSSSLDTLALRMEKHSTNALALARFLEDHPAVSEVRYPFLSSHPHYGIAEKQMRFGGGMLCFRCRGAREFLESLDFFLHTANLGDVSTIVTHPASTTHSRLSPEQRKDMHIDEDLIRVSVGIEGRDDILEAFSIALSPRERS